MLRPICSPYACIGAGLREASRGNTSSVSLPLVLSFKAKAALTGCTRRAHLRLLYPRVSTGRVPIELVEQQWDLRSRRASHAPYYGGTARHWGTRLPARHT